MNFEKPTNQAETEPTGNEEALEGISPKGAKFPEKGVSPPDYADERFKRAYQGAAMNWSTAVEQGEPSKEAIQGKIDRIEANVKFLRGSGYLVESDAGMKDLGELRFLYEKLNAQ